MKEMKEFFVFKNVNACLDHFIKKNHVEKYKKRYSPTLNICKQCFPRHGNCKRLFPTTHCLYYVHHPSNLRKSNKQNVPVSLRAQITC